ncbi:PEP-CTERM sorting domain-containing protein [Oxalobacteraceae bacterium]|nr:PEP-CTERM sorting domain-containing protein [Oxalobacteraceae bacterium]
MVMIGSRIHGTDVIEVAAAATLADIQTYTGQDQTHAANGSEWYYNGWSMGFAGLGLTIYQTSADVTSSSYTGSYPDDGLSRLSWHTDQSGPQNVPTMVIGGWRSGTNVWLNDSTDYDRVVFMAPVPEPETYGMMIAGLGILAFLARRRQAA